MAESCAIVFHVVEIRLRKGQKMSFFAIVSYSIICVVLGYMIGRSDGKQEGYIDGRSEVYKELR